MKNNSDNFFDIIIATVNREDKVVELINQLCVLQLQGRLGKVIVIDSSDSTLTKENIRKGGDVIIVRSSHKNQPYQRLLGLQFAETEYVLFLDDDMDVIDDSFCEDMKSYIVQGVSGVNLSFRNDNIFLSSIQKSVLSKNGLMKFIRALSGYAIPSSNTMGLVGLKGQRTYGKIIEYVNGGAFMARRVNLYHGISSTLFDIYDLGLGKGEDGITGFALSRCGILFAHDKVYFHHSDQNNSVYTVNHYKYQKRVAYSRLFLSFEFSKISNLSFTLALLHYQWFSIWRIAGMILNWIIKPTREQRQQIRGYISGFFYANLHLPVRYFLKKQDRNRKYWADELISDRTRFINS